MKHSSTWFTQHLGCPWVLARDAAWQTGSSDQSACSRSHYTVLCCRAPTRTFLCASARSYVRLIITADRVIIPQDGFDQRPQFHDFVKRLLGAIIAAAGARQRREDAVSAAGGLGVEQQLHGGGDDESALPYRGDGSTLVVQRLG